MVYDEYLKVISVVGTVGTLLVISSGKPPTLVGNISIKVNSTLGFLPLVSSVSVASEYTPSPPSAIKSAYC